MIKKSLTQAIAMASVLGTAGAVQAADMHINNDGLGEALLYSLYTAENNNSTNVRITNTTDFAKAVKVRFVEGQNSREVLDFNLYLSPRDQWSGAVVATENGAKLISSDKSCTAPRIPSEGVEFRNLAYTGSVDDGGDQTLARTRVGHIEIIEMGVLEEDLAKLVTADHNTPGSAPEGCDTLRAKFTNNQDAWFSVTGPKDPSVTYDTKEGLIIADTNGVRVTGGLYGSANIVNLDDTTQISYDATAIDAFIDQALENLHTFTGSMEPNLSQGQNYAVFKDGTPAEYASSIEAVSALLMKEQINNDFNVAEGLGARTNWVVTFPTKRYHVSETPVLAPFVNEWAEGQSCHTIDVAYWDHEEYRPESEPGKPGDIDFSPMPTPDTPAAVVLPALCYETNVLTLDGKNLLTDSELFSYNINLNSEGSQDYKYGWIQIGFSADYNGNSDVYELESIDATPVVAKGLPAIGFSATTIYNSSKNGHYGSSTAHKSSTSFDH